MGSPFLQGGTLKLEGKDLKAGLPVPNRSLFLEFLYNKVIKQDSNFVCIVEGKGGSGKSVSTLGLLERWCERIGRPFSIKDNVFFELQGLMGKLAELQLLKEQGVDIRGYPLLFDEAGISMDNRQWANHMHKILNDATEVFRYLNLVFFMTVPYRNRIDSKLRDLAHGTLRPLKVVNREYSVCKFYNNDRNWKGDEIFARLKAQHRGWTMIVDSLMIKKPSARVMHEYQKAQELFKGATIQGGYQKMMGKIEKDNAVEKKVLSERQRQVYYLKRQGLKNMEVAVQLGMSEGGVATHLRNIRGKGYSDVS